MTNFLLEFPDLEIGSLVSGTNEAKGVVEVGGAMEAVEGVVTTDDVIRGVEFEVLGTMAIC